MESSSVVATKIALQILIDIQADKNEKIVIEGIEYLLNKFDHEKQVWALVVDADGSWSPTWSWGEEVPENWEFAKNEWKGILTLATLRSLRDYGRIENYIHEDNVKNFKYHID